MTALRVKQKLKARVRMGLTYVDCEVENFRQPDKKAKVRDMLVDTGSLYTWVPSKVLKGIGIEVIKRNMRFVTATGKIIRRDIGGAVLRAAGFETLDEVVFARPGDLCLLGARTLEGFGALVDPREERLVFKQAKVVDHHARRKHFQGKTLRWLLT
jgi:predicted aspartyl protease